jgi:hypothetical protein
VPALRKALVESVGEISRFLSATGLIGHRI